MIGVIERSGYFLSLDLTSSENVILRDMTLSYELHGNGEIHGSRMQEGTSFGNPTDNLKMRVFWERNPKDEVWRRSAVALSP
jgi:hypothetical protein